MAAKRKTTRRQFLKGEAAIEALADVTGGPPSPVETLPGEAAARSYLFQVARRAMACEFQIYLNASQHGAAMESALQALDLVEALEDQLTVYRSHSEICSINCRAATESLPVEERLFRLLQCARQLSAATHGAFDVTAGPLSKLWGFFRREGRVPPRAEVEAALLSVGSQWIELDEAERTIHFTRPGMEINLGGIGKGYALDRCRELLEAAGVADFLIHGGHSSVLAAGSRNQANQEPGWIVGVRHPLRTGQRLLEVRLRDRSLGTSGAAKQYFYFQGQRLGHILDPRTGYPAEGVLSATALCQDAATADALATAFYVLGPEQAERFCAEHPQVGAILACPGPRAGGIELLSFGVDDADWRVCQ